jgi:hypothetical protein
VRIQQRTSVPEMPAIKKCVRGVLCGEGNGSRGKGKEEAGDLMIGHMRVRQNCVYYLKIYLIAESY